MSTSQRVTASTLMATAAATAAIGLATSAPASAGTGQHTPQYSVTAPKSVQEVRAEVVKVVKQIASSLHAKPCKSSPAPDPAS